MRTHVRSTSAVLFAMLVLAFSAGTAVARLEVSTTRIRATGSGLTFAGGEVSVICDVTLTMTLSNERIEPRTTAGGVTEARVNEASCRSGRVRLLAETPWAVRLVSFSQGVIRLQFEGMAGLVDALGGLVRCLYRGNPQLTNDAHPATRLRVDESVTLPLSRNLGGACAETLSVRGNLTISPEIAYTETDVRGMPFTSFPNPVPFRRTIGEGGVNMRNNNWIFSVTVDGHGILNAARFTLGRVEPRECVVVGRIAARETCGIDWIALVRAKGGGEPEGEYILKLREKIVGVAPLEE